MPYRKAVVSIPKVFLIQACSNIGLAVTNRFGFLNTNLEQVKARLIFRHNQTFTRNFPFQNFGAVFGS